MTTLHFVSTPHGSTFMHELLAVVAGEVRNLGTASGIDAVTVSQGAFPDDDGGVFVVEPHEYFLQTRPDDLPGPEQRARTIGFCVEHPGNESFNQTVATARDLAARVDINEDSTIALNELGMPTERFVLGYSEGWDVWHGRDRERPLDVVFLGTNDPRRSRYVSLDVAAVDECSVLLAMPPHEPMNRPRADFLVGREKLELLSGAKVMVNLHRGDSRSFEWVRALEAMCNGCVLVSEHSADASPLRPGKDVVFGSPRNLFTLSRTLLANPSRLAEVRAHCYETLRSRLSMAPSALALAQLAQEIARGGRPPVTHRGGPFRRTVARPQGGVVYEATRGQAASVAGADGLEPLGLPAGRPPAWGRRRRVPPRSPDSIDVAIACMPGGPDGSAAAARVVDQLAGAEHTLYLCSVGEGAALAGCGDETVHCRDRVSIGAALNHALEQSDAAHLLVLDSTDLLMPSGLRRVRDALRSSDAPAGYGMVIRSNGLISSAFPYEIDRIERCDYLSTAALWRRSALIDLGGWSEELATPRDVVRDLWWRLGRQGHAAAFVQRPVVRQVMAQAADERPESDDVGAAVHEGRRSVLRRPYDGVSTEIHRRDYLFQFLQQHPEVDDPLKLYIQDGRNSARRLRELLEEHAAEPADPAAGPLTVLEFASGYGCVSRHLAQQVPFAKVTCSDIHPEAMDFISRTFAMETQLSVARPEMFRLGRQFDVVFALSFFSHMPERTWGPWLEALFRHTRPGGMLVFTTHGLVSDELHIRRAELSPEGFWFEPTSEQMDLDGEEYGVTVTSGEYVMRQISTRLGDAPTERSEAFWWGHQDLYVVKRAPEAPASDAIRAPLRAARRVGPGPGAE